jgi:catechol 2,3-dioxygenase
MPTSTAGFALEFSHVGLFVMDIDRMADFYHRVLGFPITDRGMLGEAEIVFMSRDPRDHHQVILVAGRPPGLPDRIVNQVSFRVASLAELQRFYRRIRAEAVQELAPICHGNAWSVYFRDPEGNRIEVFVDTDWYIHQPSARASTSTCRRPRFAAKLRRFVARARASSRSRSGAPK